MILSRSDKLDFSVELAFVILLGGAVLSQLVLYLFVDAYNNGFGHFVSQVISITLSGMLSMLFFILLMRPIIYLIDIAPFSPPVQLLLSSLLGCAIVLLLVYIEVAPEQLVYSRDILPELLAYSLGYTVPLVYWNHRRNIWFRVKERRITANDL